MFNWFKRSPGKSLGTVAPKENNSFRTFFVLGTQVEPLGVCGRSFLFCTKKRNSQFDSNTSADNSVLYVQDILLTNEFVLTQLDLYFIC